MRTLETCLHNRCAGREVTSQLSGVMLEVLCLARPPGKLFHDRSSPHRFVKFCEPLPPSVVTFHEHRGLAVPDTSGLTHNPI